MPTIHVLRTEASRDLLAEIRRLLDLAFEGDFSDDDWDHAVGGRHVVVRDGGVVLAHAAVVPRTLHAGDRSLRTGYVEAVATTVARRRQGWGTAAMTEAGVLIRREFELGALATGEHAFYARLGWQRWRGPTSARHGAEVVRTEEDDDAVMVLRVGPSRELDLTAPLTCEGRRGADW